MLLEGLELVVVLNLGTVGCLKGGWELEDALLEGS